MKARPYESKDIQILLGECGTAHALKNGERLGQAKKTNSLFMVWNRLGLGVGDLGFGQDKGWRWAATVLCVNSRIRGLGLGHARLKAIASLWHQTLAPKPRLSLAPNPNP